MLKFSRDEANLEVHAELNISRSRLLLANAAGDKIQPSAPLLLQTYGARVRLLQR